MVIGIRTRVALTLVALVAVTVAAIGLGVYAFVDASLRTRLIADARQQEECGGSHQAVFAEVRQLGVSRPVRHGDCVVVRVARR